MLPSVPSLMAEAANASGDTGSTDGMAADRTPAVLMAEDAAGGAAEGAAEQESLASLRQELAKKESALRMTSQMLARQQVSLAKERAATETRRGRRLPSHTDDHLTAASLPYAAAASTEEVARVESITRLAAARAEVQLRLSNVRLQEAEATIALLQAKLAGAHEMEGQLPPAGLPKSDASPGCANLKKHDGAVVSPEQGRQSPTGTSAGVQSGSHIDTPSEEKELWLSAASMIQVGYVAE